MSAPAAHPAAARRLGPWSRLLTLLRRDLGLALAVGLIVAVVLVAVFAPLISPVSPSQMVAMPLLWPFQDPAYPLGSDVIGRDLLSGLVHGARISLLVGLLSALISLAIGVAIGALAGFFGGWVDTLLMRFTELFQVIPTFILVVVILAIFSPSLPLIVVAIGVSAWPLVARLTRAEFRSLKEADFVLAGRAAGLGTPAIILSEILPNALPSLVVAASVLVANGILTEAGISFLNIGDPNLVSWGSLIANGKDNINSEWFLSALPGLAIVVTVLALNILGDRLTDILNPRSEIQ